MASELRIIRFKLDEVGTALRALAPRIDLDIPGGDFVSAAPGNGQDSPSTSIVVGGEGEGITVSNGKLAASLILYCKQAGIPLPREGNKEIYVSGKFIELRIAIRHQTMAEDHSLSVQVDG
jgi:hypothetical protein